MLGARGKQIFYELKTSVVCIVSLGPARDTDRPCVTEVRWRQEREREREIEGGGPVLKEVPSNWYLVFIFRASFHSLSIFFGRMTTANPLRKLPFAAAQHVLPRLPSTSFS